MATIQTKIAMVNVGELLEALLALPERQFGFLQVPQEMEQLAIPLQPSQTPSTKPTMETQSFFFLVTTVEESTQQAKKGLPFEVKMEFLTMITSPYLVKQDLRMLLPSLMENHSTQ